MVIMVQREVAREMVAMPGKMGILSVATQIYGKPRIVCYVPPRAFRPAPKVTSAVVKIDVYPEPAIKFDSDNNFFRLVRGAFRAPRKQLRNSLSIGLGVTYAVALSMLIEAGIDSTRRAQTLSLEEWSNLYQAFNSMADFSRK
jgi:16S rRNA (adenine1518-N6/adenine1519-N6)-dimethyltransferase